MPLNLRSGACCSQQAPLFLPMPELPEVETRVREMRAPCVGQTITAVEVLWQRQVVVPDVAEFEQRLLGQTIQAVERRGKYLVFCPDPRLLVDAFAHEW
jgi:formamidopyrimidine-DNA glycosylase